MPVLKPTGGLLGWVAEWCSRPAMFFVLGANQRIPNIDCLPLLVEGYESCLRDRQYDSEWAAFVEWLQAENPDWFVEGYSWFGQRVLAIGEGDQFAAAALIANAARTFLATCGEQSSSA